MLGLGSSLATSGVTSEFSPSNISSLIHWYKHSEGIEEADGSFPEDGEQITAWRDQKGSEDVTSGEGTFMTWNDTEEALVANGDTKKLRTSGDVTLSGRWSMYVRIKFVAVSSGDVFVQDTDDAGMFFRINSATTVKMKIGGAALAWDGGTINTGQYYNIGVERNGSNEIRAYVDGAEYGSAVSNSSDFVWDTIKGGFNDFFKTAIICNSELISGDRAALNTYLNNI